MFKVSVVISSKIVYFKIWIKVTNIISPWEVIQNTIEIVVEIYLIEKKIKELKVFSLFHKYHFGHLYKLNMTVY